MPKIGFSSNIHKSNKININESTTDNKTIQENTKKFYVETQYGKKPWDHSQTSTITNNNNGFIVILSKITRGSQQHQELDFLANQHLYHHLLHGFQQRKV